MPLEITWKKAKKPVGKRKRKRVPAQHKRNSASSGAKPHGNIRGAGTPNKKAANNHKSGSSLGKS